MNAFPTLNDVAAAGIAWAYLSINSARVFTYIPQIVAVWRCTDGARAVSLLAWASWALSNLTSVLYGALVVHDAFFAAISAINFAGCATVAGIAAQRRRSVRAPCRERPARRPLPAPAVPGHEAGDPAGAAAPLRRRLPRSDGRPRSTHVRGAARPERGAARPRAEHQPDTAAARV